MEFGSIDRELYIDAAPEIVFDVVSNPKHVSQWWPDEATYEAVPGSTGQVAFGDKRENLMVIEVEPPRTFSFRWTHPAGEVPAAGNSLLVTFDLTPSGAGTLLRMTETGFRELGWEAALLEHQYREHVTGWDFYLPRLASHAATVRP
jgi:uncharacterized protein YndB with AHSA1/START domain